MTEHCGDDDDVVVAGGGVVVVGIHGSDGHCWLEIPQTTFQGIELETLAFVVVACGFDVAVARLVAEDSMASARAMQYRGRAVEDPADPFAAVLVAVAFGVVEYSQTSPRFG